MISAILVSTYLYWWPEHEHKPEEKYNSEIVAAFWQAWVQVPTSPKSDQNNMDKSMEFFTGYDLGLPTGNTTTQACPNQLQV